MTRGRRIRAWGSQYNEALHIDWLAVVDAVGYPAAGLGILVESSGIPFPGETLLLAAAAWAAARNHSIVLVILFGFLGATAGADLGYFLGFRGGRPFVERFGSLFRIRPEHIARSEMFFARHGDRAILLARFVLGLRTWGSMLAGMAHMPFWVPALLRDRRARVGDDH